MDIHKILPPRPEGVSDAEWDEYVRRVRERAETGIPNPTFGIPVPGRKYVARDPYDLTEK